MLSAKPAEPMVPVPIGKGCLLLLTQGEYLRALARGKAFRRREALQARIPQPTSPCGVSERPCAL